MIALQELLHIAHATAHAVGLVALIIGLIGLLTFHNNASHRDDKRRPTAIGVLALIAIAGFVTVAVASAVEDFCAVDGASVRW